jgi:hypothetical protein
MTENKAKGLFEKYNPASDVIRCPNGRAKMRKPLDLYAKAAVNLYGIIRRDEFVEIFNAQNEEQTTVGEVYAILLPNVRKFGWYGFYKDYIVHYAILSDFDWVEHLKSEQAGKPRYIPAATQFLRHEREEYEDNDHWENVLKFMLNTIGYKECTVNGFVEIKSYLMHSRGIKELGPIMNKHNLAFENKKQVEEFFNLLTLAKNNTRKWENKGYTPNELMKLREVKQPQKPVFQFQKKIGPNQPCPCGSGKKYKNCCSLIENSGTAQLSHSECKLFYETWYKLLDFVNHKLHVVDYRISHVYPDYHDETLLLKIREKLWRNPKLIRNFLGNTPGLSAEEISLLQSWEKHHVKGQFVLLKYEPEYAVLMRMDKSKTNTLYAVKGMASSFSKAMHSELPVIIETVLLPFGESIVYDSFIASHSIKFGDGIRNMLEEEYINAKNKCGIVMKLGEHAGSLPI